MNQAVEAYQAIRANKVEARLYLGGIGHPPSDGSLDSPGGHLRRRAGAGLVRPPPQGRGERHRRAAADRVLRGRLLPQPLGRHDAHREGVPVRRRRRPCTCAPPARTAARCRRRPARTRCRRWRRTPPPARATTRSRSPPGSAEELKEGFAEYLGPEVPDLHDAPTDAELRDPRRSTRPLELAGIPELRLQVAAADVLPVGVEPATAAAFQLDPKLYDVAPGRQGQAAHARGVRGAARRRRAGTSTVPAHEVRFDAFGLSNTIPAGHRLRITLQTSDAALPAPDARTRSRSRCWPAAASSCR